MFLRLSRTRRLWAGYFVALVYALCILAPTLSFALPGSRALSPCLTGADHVPGMMHVHAKPATAHIHADGHVHDHALAHSHTSAADEVTSVKAPGLGEQAPSTDSHSFDCQCCGLTCLSALPATLLEVVAPSVPTASKKADRYRDLADNGPSERYRPPIA